MKKPEPQPLKTVLFQLAFGALFGAGVGYWGVTFIQKSGDAAIPNLVGLLAVLVGSFFLTTVIHECGHLAAALSQGFRFRVLTIGPLAIVDTPNGFRFSWNFRVMMLIMGQQISTPPARTANHPGATVKNFMVYLAGGGAANLLTAAIAVLLLITIVNAFWIKVFLLAFIAISVFLGVINLLPIATAQGIKTDGFHMRALRRGDATVFLTLFEYIRDVYEGVHPRDWQPDLLQRIEERASNDLERSLAFVMRLTRAIANNDCAAASQAAQQLESVYANIPKALRTQYAAELVHHFAMFEGNAEKAKQYSNDAKRVGYLGSPATPVRVAACVAFVEGRYADAEKLCEQAIALAPQGLNALDRMMEPELAREVLRRVQQKAVA